MNIHYLLFIVTFTLKILAMEDGKLVPLPGPAQFSPSGKFLLVIGKQNISVHDTNTGKSLGALEGITPKQYGGPQPFTFSPRETYLAYRNKIWALTSQKLLLPHSIRPVNVKTYWNTLETIFITSRDSNNRDVVSDALTGKQLNTLNPLSQIPGILNDNGTLIAYVYTLAHPIHDRYPQTLLQINRVAINQQTCEVPNGQKIVFFSDNEHALVSKPGADVVLLNAAKGQPLRTFVCGASSALVGTLTDRTACTIKTQGMKSIITHPSAKEYFCTINHDGKDFYFEKRDKTLIRPKTLTYPTEHYLKKHAHYAYNLSPDGSAIVFTVAKGQQAQYILCILPHAYELSARDKQSYLSLLPEDIRNCLRYYQTPQDDFAKVNDATPK